MRNQGKQVTGTARASFSAGLLLRGTVESELHRHLSSYLDVEYDLKTLHKGWLTSTYRLDIQYYGENQKFFKDVVVQPINDYFKQVNRND